MISWKKMLRLKKHSIVPGFNISMGITLLYVTLLILIPLSMIFIRTASMDWVDFWRTVTSDRVIASYKLTLSTSLIAALINVFFGLIISWVLVRYKFPGRRIIDGLIDLPFALPTALAGIVLTTLYAENGWIGKYFSMMGIKVSYTSMGIVVALAFIGLPFIVRTVQPVLIGLDKEVEESAASLGAKPTRIFISIIFPEILPALLTGFALAFARSLGEYGSVVFISGNMPMKTEITSFMIITKLEQYDYLGATAIASVMLVASFIMLLVINILQWWSSKKCT
jgi:sulfate/thiosulfate transport system permease protein